MDLRKGLYRLIYAGFIWGRRINSVPLEAEAWFWRLHAVADDHGNLPAEEARLGALTKGYRADMRDSDVGALCARLEMAGLIARYEAGGEQFYHILDFPVLQPAPRNGRRLQRFHLHPPGLDRGEAVGESGGIRGNPGEPWGTRGSPGESGGIQTVRASHSHSHTHSQQHHQQHSDAHAQTHAERNPAAAAAAVGLSSEEIESRAAYLSRKPSWLGESKRWLSPAAVREFAGDVRVTEAVVAEAYAEGKAARSLSNPAGVVIKHIRQAVQGVSR